MRPKTEIYVSNKDAEQAEKVLHDLHAWADPNEMTEDELKSLELPQSDIPEIDGETNLPLDSSDIWDRTIPAPKFGMAIRKSSPIP